MLRRELRRWVWGAAAAVVALAALVAIAAILSGDFDTTDGQILATLGLVLLSGLTTLAGLGLVERRVAVAFGWAVAVWGPTFFVLEAAWVWSGFDGDRFGKLAVTGFVLLPVGLIASTTRLVLRDGRLLPVFVGECVALALAAWLSIDAIWTDYSSDAVGQLVAALWVLAVLGWAVVPLLQRAMTPGRRRRGETAAANVERVPAEDVAPGETAVFLRAGQLVFVVGGREQHLGADEALVIRP